MLLFWPRKWVPLAVNKSGCFSHSNVFYQAKPEFQNRFTAALIFPAQTDR